jgi:xanthine dehydrogenase YagS FAD-binding subunit
MRSFLFERATTVEEAMRALSAPDAMAIAGGTELLNWMKEGIVAPKRLVDINALTGLDRIEVNASGLRLGALARMSDIAGHEVVSREFPVISQALLASASPQLRNMASIAGNLLQRTRCPYFRADTELACNKRNPGSGCSALQGEDRSSAIFGKSEHCVATHPSDVAVAFATLDASIEIRSGNGTRTVRFSDFHRLPDSAAVRETTVRPGELITSITVPASPWARQSHFLKVRERASYEFALVSAAAAIQMRGKRIWVAKLTLGGVAHKPWRLASAEDALRDVDLSDAAALRSAIAGSFNEARAGRHNTFKVELGMRTAIRALQAAGGVAR